MHIDSERDETSAILCVALNGSQRGAAYAKRRRGVCLQTPFSDVVITIKASAEFTRIHLAQSPLDARYLTLSLPISRDRDLLRLHCVDA
ncbi:hypothetical protein NWI01_30110 [Nitrobacter winogradskyi]|uniref:Uncharacterized protein n=1 Tax=Nitrobacter winogradskyi TaxID=913 RepID=A0A4Y3WH20_NITWI|nr:hypothetical protein NWI01_30110 [Nitrobacter winogradskyi]